ncbi:GGDEF domain-containing protein [Actinoplanes sp. NPDC051851]|uniref:GGDEF domain-containing protein n=1 Tax=Actinoplanes sp. NPDC051851 TaxID=3154753 RepID=UPI0034277F82
MPYQLRDQPSAARSVAYLMLVAGPYNLITGVLMKLGDPVGQLVTLALASVVFTLTGLLCWFRPAALPRLFWLIVPFLSIGVVTVLNLATHDASTGAQLFYLWPLLFTASFLGRRVIALNVAAISGGHALVAFTVLTGVDAMNDWIAVTVAMTMTALVVAGLNERNDRLLEVLADQATTDALTGAANRRAFDTGLRTAVASATAGGEPAALLMVDVDHFKQINDTWGHAVGDRALLAVADALREAADGAACLVARLGGDEFAVLLRAGPRTALRYADRARAALAATEGLPGGPPKLSIGIGVLPQHATTADELQRVADAALYSAKAGGRGRSALAHTAPHERHNVDRIPTPNPALH